ncbi:MAG: AgmX/PglI C-terminal domain-containing protein [Nannocystaceae bacterium]|nr:AgmX/PglI C-terminal domain-containing protein [bacterium]
MRSNLCAIALVAACTPSGSARPPEPAPAQPATAENPAQADDEARSAPLDHASIDEAIRSRLVDLRACYDARVAKEPGLEGVVVATFVIDAQGAAKELTFTSESLDDAELNGCLAGILSTIEFPAPPEGEELAIKYPFDFRASRAEPAGSGSTAK